MSEDRESSQVRFHLSGTDAEPHHPAPSSADAPNAVPSAPASSALPLPRLVAQPSSTSAEVATVSMPALPPVTLSFHNLTYKVKNNQLVKGQPGQDGEWKTLLDNISGAFLPGRFCAVMGSSGAGKTTLLNAISAQQTSTVSLHTQTGDVRVNGQVITNKQMHELSAYIQQDDVILGTQTTYDTLLFNALLKLPKTMPYDEKVQRAEDVLRLLELEKCRDTIAGDVHNKGISGGEKRRLSVGMELVLASSCIFLDEPSSGLDVNTAHTLIQILRSLAHVHGRTVVCTIHQPSSDIFHLFDDLMMLSEGKIIYSGPAQSAVDYFGRLSPQFVCPTDFNPADFFFMQILNDWTQQAEVIFGGGEEEADAPLRLTVEAIKLESQKSFRDKIAKERERVAELVKSWESSAEHQAVLQTIEEITAQPTALPDTSQWEHERPGFWFQFQLLSRRRWHDLIRDKMKYRAQSMQYFFFALVLGLTFLQINLDQKSVQDREGSLFFITVQAVFMSYISNLNTFGGEKLVFEREYNSGMYGISSYFWSRWLVEVPFKIIFPFIYATISYWLVGYQNDGERYILYVIILIILDNLGSAMGVCICSVFSDVMQAMQAGPSILIPLMVFSGFYVNMESIGWWFRWMSYISPVRYGYIAVLRNEMRGLVFTCPEKNATNGVKCGIDTGEQDLSLLSLDSQPSMGESIAILIGLQVGILFLALWLLARGINKKK